MKNATLLRVGKESVAARWFGLLAIAVLLPVAVSLKAQTPTETETIVTTLGGGPQYYNPGHSFGSSNSVYGTLYSQFHTPSGLAYDSFQGYLYVADRDNNAIRLIDIKSVNPPFEIFTFAPDPPYVPTNVISQPVGVAVDALSDVFVLNRGKGTNGTVVEFDYLGNLIATNMTRLTNASGIALDTIGDIYVTTSNTVFKITPAGVSNVVVTITNAGTFLQGIVVKRSGPNAGWLAVCDSGRNGIYLINPTSGAVTTNAGFNGAGDGTGNRNQGVFNASARFFQPSGIAEAGDGSLIVTDFGNQRVKVVTVAGLTTNLYGVSSNDWWGGPGATTPTGGAALPGWSDGAVWEPDGGPGFGNVQARMPFGVAFGYGPDGTTPTIYVTEDYYHIIRTVTGANLAPPPPFPPPPPTGPTATAGYGQVFLTWTASAGATNYNVKRSTSSGGETTNSPIASTTGTSYTDTSVFDGTTYYYVVSALNTGGPGQNSAEVIATPLFSPPPASLIVTATNFGQISLAWSPSAGATSYNVKRSPSHLGPYTIIASTASASYSDNSVVNGTTYYYVVSAVNAGGENPTNSAEVSATVPIPPPPSPVIGWFDYEGTAPPVTVFHPVSGTAYITHNDLSLAIEPAADGVATYYTDDGSDPSASNGGTPPPFVNNSPLSYTNLPVTPASDLTIKAVNVNSGGSSAIVTAEFIFQVGNPQVVGNNAAQFTVGDITAGAQMYYTTDGSVPSPTNVSAIGPITNGTMLSLQFPASTNLLQFQIAGFKANYQPSAIVTNTFYASNYVANTISFGFASGEASSDFVGTPGQTFYAPVTLTTLPNTKIYSLQFNVTVTNAGPNPGPVIGGPPAPFGFSSMMLKPLPPDTNFPSGVQLYTPIPPMMFVGSGFTNLVFTNLSANLLGVGWVERYTKTNLYNTLSQDLIQYSQAHDDLFPNPQQPNGVIVGGYSFTIPANATPGQTYQIRIGRPTATDDGIGAPGSSVYIATPTNGSLAGGVINAIKNVTVGSRKYLVGNVYPFRWFNAGDFGNTNLQNADVEQVFEAAIYKLNSPAFQAPGSDFFDAMDSCGTTYVDNGHGYLQPSVPPASTSVLFDGNDTTINQIAFGDGVLDVCDVYVTYRRSLDPTLTWFRRFWTNDVAHVVSGRVAETTANIYQSGVAKQSSGGKIQPAVNPNPAPISITNTPSVNFTAGDFQATAGQQISIPVTASVFGPYPLRVAMLNITVVPLDGSPALTTPISFSPGAALGAPNSEFIVSDGPGNYAAAWLDSTIAGISNGATIGTLNVTIPANATSSSAYAIHFDHASGSPNGLASFPKQMLTGLITLSSRTNSYYHDGIPDSWRLRYFGTIYNLLSISNTCPSGDGVNNWQKYIAGVDPNTPNDFPSLNPNTPPPSGAAMSIYWPTVSGKQYAILSSASLFPGNWITNAILTGTGTDMEFDDNSTGTVKFYRVLILP